MGDASRPCSCSPAGVKRYRAKLSSPLLNRVDIHMNAG
ncbi:MAG: ATP-binding protein [Gemmatimonadales bacterium]